MLCSKEKYEGYVHPFIHAHDLRKNILDPMSIKYDDFVSSFVQITLKWQSVF